MRAKNATPVRAIDNFKGQKQISAMPERELVMKEIQRFGSLQFRISETVAK